MVIMDVLLMIMFNIVKLLWSLLVSNMLVVILRFFWNLIIVILVLGFLVSLFYLFV